MDIRSQETRTPYPRMRWNGHLCPNNPSSCREARIELFGRMGTLPAADRRRLREARHQRNELSTAIVIPGTYGTIACTNCPEPIRLETGDGLAFQAIEPCPFPDGHRYAILLDVPSGEMVWLEGLEQLVPPNIGRFSDSLHPAWTRRLLVEALAQDGVAAFENRVAEWSRLRREPDGSYTVRSREDVSSGGVLFIEHGMQRVFDRADFLRRGGVLRPDAPPGAYPVRRLSVRPGRYRFTNSYDALPRGEPGTPQTLLRIERVGDIAPP